MTSDDPRPSLDQVPPPAEGNDPRPPRARYWVLGTLVVMIVSTVGFVVSYKYTRSHTTVPTTSRTRPTPLPASRLPRSTTPMPPQDATVARVFEQSRSSVVAVTGRACDLAVTGTGWFAEKDLVVTNAHVVAGMKAPSVTTADGQSREAHLMAFDPANDVAVLKTQPAATPLTQSVAVPREGSGAVAVVFGEMGPEARSGTVRQAGRVDTVDIYDRPVDNRHVLVLDMNLVAGDSGSPILATDGRVIATAAASDPADRKMIFAVPNDEVAASIASAHSATGPVSSGPCISE